MMDQLAAQKITRFSLSFQRSRLVLLYNILRLLKCCYIKVTSTVRSVQSLTFKGTSKTLTSQPRQNSQRHSVFCHKKRHPESFQKYKNGENGFRLHGIGVTFAFENAIILVWCGDTHDSLVLK